MCLIAALLCALGIVFYQNYAIKYQEAAQVSPTVVKQSNSDVDHEPAQVKNGLVVKEWNVKFVYPDGITSAAYELDTSNALFLGPVARITSITTADGKTVKLATDAEKGQSGVNAICSVVAIGKSSNATVDNPTVGGNQKPVSSLDGAYYYNVAAPGAVCSTSESATATVKKMVVAFSTVQKP